MFTGVNTPDIICLKYRDWQGYNSIISGIIENGLYADLYEFIDSDPDIKKDDIMGAVRNTFEIDGKLLLAMPSFSIKTIIAPKSEVGERNSWNYDEIFDFIDSLPPDKKLTEDTFTTLDFNNAFGQFTGYPQ